MGKYKPKRFTTQLPATPCEPEFRERVERFAVDNGKSLAEVMRDAIGKILPENDSKTIISDSKESHRLLEKEGSR